MEVEIGTISARGQIAIPARMRKTLDFKEGDKLLFLQQDDSIILKRTSNLSWEELTKPLQKDVVPLTDAMVDKAVRWARSSSTPTSSSQHSSGAETLQKSLSGSSKKK